MHHWVHQTCDPCVVVHWQCINSQSEVVRKVIQIDIFTGDKAPSLEIHGSLTIKWYVVYFPKSILSLCQTAEGCNGPNWHCVVLRPLNYQCICEDQ